MDTAAEVGGRRDKKAQWRETEIAEAAAGRLNQRLFTGLVRQ